MSDLITGYQMLELGLKTVGAIIPAGALLFAANQYSNAQNWKKHEFVSSVWKEIEKNTCIAATLTMLDWNERYVTLIPGDDDVLVTDAILVEALVPHTETDKTEFSYEESAIRDCFDEFFEALERINHFIEAELFSADDVRVYVEYWLELITTNSKGGKQDETLSAIWKFIRAYKYDGVEELCRKLGLTVPPMAESKEVNSSPVRRTRKQYPRFIINTWRKKLLTGLGNPSGNY